MRTVIRHILPLQVIFAWRYFKSKKSLQAINIISRITTISIAVGTAALLIVLSIFNGFEGLVKDLYASFYPDIRIVHKQAPIYELSPAQYQQLTSVAGIKTISLTLESNGLFQYENNRVNLVMKGVDENYASVSGLPERITKGIYSIGDENRPFAVIGNGLENALRVETDRTLLPITAYVPKKNSAFTQNPMDAISTFTIYPVGSFSIQQEFDNRYAITHITLLRQMLGISERSVSSVEMKSDGSADEKTIIAQLKKIMGEDYLIENRYQQNKTLYGVMQSEKWVIFGILGFILVLASFNMLGTLTLLVLEKQKDIQIIKALGAHEHWIFRVFLTESIFIGLIGGLIGWIAAFAFCFLQQTFHLIPLQGSFVIDYYPVKMMTTDVLLVILIILIIAILAGIYPSRKASQKQFSLKAQ